MKQRLKAKNARDYEDWKQGSFIASEIKRQKMITNGFINSESEDVDSICPICRETTYVGETINCEKCSHWFHFECIGVTHSNQDVPFYCSKCGSPNCINIGNSESEDDDSICPMCEKSTDVGMDVKEEPKFAVNLLYKFTCVKCHKGFKFFHEFEEHSVKAHSRINFQEKQ